MSSTIREMTGSVEAAVDGDAVFCASAAVASHLMLATGLAHLYAVSYARF